VQVLGDLFAAGEIEDEAERQAAKDRAFKGLATLLRYQARIGREHRAAMQALDSLRQRRLARAPARPGEPEQAVVARPEPLPATVSAGPSGRDLPARPSEPEPTLNRHQRRALKAMARQQGGRLAA
jgi:hypothetical protein